MKMNFKETALLLGMSMAVPATSIAQDKVEASVGADLVSGYIWRGQDLGGVSYSRHCPLPTKDFRSVHGDPQALSPLIRKNWT